jgi:hypothetical protein
MPKDNPYERDLDRNAANYAPLTPLSFIARTAYIWPDRLAVIHGPRRYTWRDTYARARRTRHGTPTVEDRHAHRRRRDHRPR